MMKFSDLIKVIGVRVDNKLRGEYEASVLRCMTVVKRYVFKSVVNGTSLEIHVIFFRHENSSQIRSVMFANVMHCEEQSLVGRVLRFDEVSIKNCLRFAGAEAERVVRVHRVCQSSIWLISGVKVSDYSEVIGVKIEPLVVTRNVTIFKDQQSRRISNLFSAFEDSRFIVEVADEKYVMSNTEFAIALAKARVKFHNLPMFSELTEKFGSRVTYNDGEYALIGGNVQFLNIDNYPVRLQQISRLRLKHNVAVNYNRFIVTHQIEALKRFNTVTALTGKDYD